MSVFAASLSLLWLCVSVYWLALVIFVSFTCRCGGKELTLPLGAGAFWGPLGLGSRGFYLSRSLPGL